MEIGFAAAIIFSLFVFGMYNAGGGSGGDYTSHWADPLKTVFQR